MRAGEKLARALLLGVGIVVGTAVCLILFVVSFLLALKLGGGVGTGIWVFCWFCAYIWTQGDVTVVDDLTKGRR